MRILLSLKKPLMNNSSLFKILNPFFAELCVRYQKIVESNFGGFRNTNSLYKDENCAEIAHFVLFGTVFDNTVSDKKRQFSLIQ